MRPVKTIIVGTDFSDLATLAVQSGFALAKAMEARVHLVHVMAPWIAHGPYAYLYAQNQVTDVDRRRRQEALDALEDYVAEGVTITRELREGLPSLDLAAAADDAGADLVIVASHGYGGLRRALLGSVTAALIRVAQVPVLVVGQGRRARPFERVVAGVDLSPLSTEILAVADAFTVPGGSIHVVSVYDVPLVLTEATTVPRYLPEPAPERIRAVHREAVVELLPRTTTPSRFQVDTLAVRTPAYAILDAAEDDDADLVVIGTSGHNAWHRMILGSTASRVVAQAGCPVLVVPNAALDAPVARSEDAVAGAAPGMRHA